MDANKINRLEQLDGLVSNQASLSALKKIQHWLQTAKLSQVTSAGENKTTRGYRALFIGSTNNAKASANLIASSAGTEIYTVNLSKLVSKYIAETEKNLEAVFAKAAERNVILFFDEADALFGQRSSGEEKESGSPASLLLQKIDLFAGCCILSLTNKAADDSLPVQRFQSVVYFPLPDR